MKINKTIIIFIICRILLVFTKFKFKKKYNLELSECNTWKGHLTYIDKQAILNSHNWYRNQIALQTNKLGPILSFAKNMLQMYWSDSIAEKAQQWANSCEFRHSTLQFREQPDFATGENLHESSSGTNYEPMNWFKPLVAWFNEIKDFGGKNIDSMSPNGPVTEHFTQLIWANSYLIGCGFAQFKKGAWFKSLYVCQYGPAGNIVGQPIYSSSPSRDCVCPLGTACANEAYKGLCCAANFCNWKSQIYAGPVIPGIVSKNYVSK